ncbi:MAG: phosphate acetyltransferase [Chlorobi bacterium]|nr:phosphate acetyltransferase [Chlorobiota bacterium]
MELLENIKQNAASLKKRIVLPESFDERTLKAADTAYEQGIAEIILIGKKEKVLADAERLGLKNIDKIKITDADSSDKTDEYAELMYNLRKHKGWTKNKSYEFLQNPLYFSVMMIKAGDADGEVAGAANATGNVLLPAFQFIKTAPGIKVVSGAFLMFLKDKQFGENGLMLFADCAVHPDPDAEQLAQIAVSTGQTARVIAGIEPKIAMLSFSTKGSASHELVDKVVKATEIAQRTAPDMQIDGELQADAAIVEAIGKKKAPGSKIAGQANVLVFPDLQSGNIAYKLVQRMAGAEAIGPILQGMAAPVNDLSRGCSVSDIVNLIAITANQASMK